MTFEKDYIPALRGMFHYYGDAVRLLFLSAAILLILGETTGADLPLSAGGAIAGGIILVISAGLTNPQQEWIHWANELIAVAGTFIFSLSSVQHWRQGGGIFTPSYFFTEVIAILFLISLYYTTKTIRGIEMRPMREE